MRRKRAALQSKVGGTAQFIRFKKKSFNQFIQSSKCRRTVEHARKVAVMRKANDIARNYDERIKQVGLRYIDEEQNVLIANSEGKFVEDTRVYSRLSIQATASDGIEMQTGFYGPGAHAGFEFIENLDLESLCK